MSSSDRCPYCNSHQVCLEGYSNGAEILSCLDCGEVWEYIEFVNTDD